MAIEKKIVTSNGYDATYWRIGFIQADRQCNSVFFRIDGYKDAGQRLESVSGIAESRNYTVPMGQLAGAFSVESVYQHVKSLPEFEGAIDA